MRPFPAPGQVTVVGCEAQDQWGADQWHCQSRLTVDDVAQAEVATTLVVGKGAVVPDRPFVGERRRVYFEVPGQGTAAADGKPELVYDQASQLTELTRLYISLLPWTLVLIGSLAWLLGWFVNRQAARHPGQSGWWDRVMFRFGLQRRGWAYLGLGLAAAIVNLLLVQYVVGSVGAA